MSDAAQILGMKDLEKQYGKLEMILDDRDLEDGFLAGCRKMRDRMRSKVKKKTGALGKAIVAKKFRYKIKGQPAAFVAVDRRKAPHAHLVEFGHGGPQPAPAHGFFRPVVDEFETNGSEVEQAVAQKLQSLIEGVSR